MGRTWWRFYARVWQRMPDRARRLLAAGAVGGLLAALAWRLAGW